MHVLRKLAKYTSYKIDFAVFQLTSCENCKKIREFQYWNFTVGGFCLKYRTVSKSMLATIFYLVGIYTALKLVICLEL
jgi:hypothetical protein